MWVYAGRGPMFCGSKQAGGPRFVGLSRQGAHVLWVQAGGGLEASESYCNIFKALYKTN